MAKVERAKAAIEAAKSQAPGQRFSEGKNYLYSILGQVEPREE
jgi:hypothetical protein